MTGRYQAYSEYKSTDTDWLGKAPSHWKTIPVGRLFGRVKRTDFTDKELLSVYRDYGVIPKSSRDDNNNKPSEDLTPYQLVEPNDLVMNKMKTWQGSIAISEYEGIVSPAYFVYKPKPNLFCVAHPKYVHYLLRNPMYIAQYLRRSKGIRVNQWDLDPGEFQRVELLLPEKDEQLKIFQFLDHETAKIDILIEKQQQLIKLLKEKRQAVISHAVTKGLNPNAPMRDSGVEWLGQVPEHWKVSRIKNVVTKIVDGPHFSPKYHDEGYMFISARNIKVDRWSLGDAKYVSEADFNEFNKRVRPEIGDVLLTKGGTTGVARAVDLDFPFQVWVHVAVLKTIQTMMDPFYLAYVLNGTACYEQSQQYTFGATNNDLGLSRIAKIFFARPPIKEQCELRLWLDDECKKFDRLIAKGIESIELMQERRTALISAAVTGKIDVRGWQASASQHSRDDAAA